MSKSIFVTGGASGIGRAIARRFAEEGWTVGLGDVDEGGMAETCAMLPEGRCHAFRLDVTDPQQWDRTLAAFADRTGGAITVLANNAGVPLGGSLMTNGTAEIERCIAINLTGVIHGARAAHDLLARAGEGACLLNTASAAGIYGTPGTSVYAATKAGVRSLTETLDGEWAGDGIAVRSLCPGFIDTPLLDHNASASSNEQIRQRVRAAGLEITPVGDVAEAAWRAVHGKRLHTLVGKTARRMNFARRFTPGRLRRMVGAAGRPMGR
ncbi:SDR family oxidoreductase [Aurantiacibacter spongiae]|uniref:SDR family oxidoreductase n=1 Tax=Aurantiacibacter spongiae TaxID=2488860 RepID=A0A3N5CUN1_9SPHN|nr:SDR family oxidoreductase [Aurantiacibacter spongiae]RPF72046.1 SDR family oxidoreductase [Aurantiacibacter spongiae]